MVYIVVHDLSRKWTIYRIMGYIVDHEMIKSWNMYKSIIYIKDGQHIGPLLGLNVGQYIKPLTN